MKAVAVILLLACVAVHAQPEKGCNDKSKVSPPRMIWGHPQNVLEFVLSPPWSGKPAECAGVCAVTEGCLKSHLRR